MGDLVELRQKIDLIDKDLLNLIAKRLNVAQKIAEYKRINHLPIHDPAREESKINSLKKLAKLSFMDENQITEIFTNIIEITRQNEQD